MRVEGPGSRETAGPGVIVGRSSDPVNSPVPPGKVDGVELIDPRREDRRTSLEPDRGVPDHARPRQRARDPAGAAAHDRQLSPDGAPGLRRDEQGLSGDPPGLSARGRRQGPAPVPGQEPRDAPEVPPRGQERREPGRPQHRGHLRPGLRGRAVLPGAGVRAGQRPARPRAQERADADRRGGGRGQAGGPGFEARGRSGPDSSGHQAGEHPPPRGWRGEGDRPGPGPAGRGRGRAGHPRRDDGRDRGLHGPGAGPRQPRHQRVERHVFARVYAVLPAHGDRPVRGRGRGREAPGPRHRARSGREVHPSGRPEAAVPPDPEDDGQAAREAVRRLRRPARHARCRGRVAGQAAGRYPADGPDRRGRRGPRQRGPPHRVDRRRGRPGAGRRRTPADGPDRRGR